MKSTITAYLLGLLMFVGTFKGIIPFAEYSMNQEYIIAELCVNKDVPSLNCNGKCYLKKRVASISMLEMESDNSIPNKVPIPELSKFVETASYSFNISCVSKREDNPILVHYSSSEYVLDLIKPPEA